tara:strand:- start:1068 stop:2102 length:1035 start_codon:yes stop_codon:yes gene_type:complete
MKKLLLFSLSIIFIMIIVSSQGFLGSNLDICAYRVIPNDPFRLIEFVGGHIATLTYKSNYIAPYFISSLLFISFFFYINKILKKLSIYQKSKLFTNKQRELYSLTIATSSLLIWPFYIYLTNALRQGVAIGFAVVTLNLLISDNFKFKNFLLLISFLLVAFSHRSGLLFIFAMGFSFFQSALINKINFSQVNKKILSIVTSIIAVFGIIQITGIDKYVHKTLGFEMGIPLMILSIFSIFLLLSRYNIQKSVFPFTLFNINLFFSLLIIFIYYNSYSSERLFPYFLITIFPIILEIFVLKIKQTIFTIFLIIFMGFSITFLSGQYISNFQHSIDNGRWCSKINEL